MKNLIFIGIMIAPAVIMAVCNMNGVVLGAIPVGAMFGGAAALGRGCANLWKKNNKKVRI